MQYCSQCGTEVAAGQKFCTKCGTKTELSMENMTDAPAGAAPEPSPAASSRFRKQPKTGVIVIVCVAACLLLAAAGFAWYYLKVHNAGNMASSGENSPRDRITFTDADDFIKEWSACQTNRDVKSYLDLYSTDFQGIKRTKSGRTYRMGFSQWATDRARMYAGAQWVTVTATGLEVTGTDESTGAVTIEFDQTYDSDSYHDTGRKIMTLKRDASGRIRISREEMVYAFATESAATPPPTEDQDISGETPGRFPECSLRPLARNELMNKSEFDLKVMRNEIYARHGYIFSQEDMRDYFSSQPWYAPRHADVTRVLTAVEIGNIELIRSFERRF